MSSMLLESNINVEEDRKPTCSEGFSYLEEMELCPGHLRKNLVSQEEHYR